MKSQQKREQKGKQHTYKNNKDICKRRSLDGSVQEHKQKWQKKKAKMARNSKAKTKKRQKQGKETKMAAKAERL